MGLSAMGPHPFTLRQLQYVVAVADAPGFRKAAELCHVSQPSLSAQINEVERALGTTLFERSPKGVLLTSAGRELVERAREVLLRADDLVVVAKRFVDPFAGVLRLGVIPTIAPYLLPEVAPRLSAAFPKLAVRWTEDKTESLVGEVNAGRLDAVLLAKEADLADLTLEVVGLDPFVFAAPEGHPLARKAGPVKENELAEQRILLLEEGHCFRAQALSYCSRARVDEMEYRATSLPTLVQMVASGAGITLLPKMAVATETRRAALVVRDLAKPVPSRTLVVAYRKSTPLAEVVLAVAAQIRAACALEKRA